MCISDQGKLARNTQGTILGYIMEYYLIIINVIHPPLLSLVMTKSNIKMVFLLKLKNRFLKNILKYGPDEIILFLDV